MRIRDIGLIALSAFCLGCDKSGPAEPAAAETNRIHSAMSMKESGVASRDKPENINDAIEEWSANIEEIYLKADLGQIDGFVSRLEKDLKPIDYGIRKQLLYRIGNTVHDDLARYLNLCKRLEKGDMSANDFMSRFKKFCHFSEALSSLVFSLAEDAVWAADYDCIRCQNIKSLIQLGRKIKSDEMVALGEARLEEWLEKYYDAEDCHLKLAMERGHGKGIDHPSDDTYELRIELLKYFFRTVRTRPPKWYVGKEFENW